MTLDEQLNSNIFSNKKSMTLVEHKNQGSHQTTVSSMVVKV